MHKILNFFIFIVVLIILVLTIYYLLTFPKIGLDNYYIGVSQILSGLIAGLLTYIGVSITILNNNKDREINENNTYNRMKERTRLDNLPVLHYQCLAVDERTNVNKIKDYKKDKILINSKLSIHNIGLKSAQHILIQYIVDLNDNKSKFGVNNSLIQPNEKEDFTNHISLETLDLSELLINFKENKQYIDYHPLTIIVYYDDLIGNHYIQELIGGISIIYYMNEIEDSIEISNSIYINETIDYKIVEKYFQYSVPKETIDLYAKQKKDILRFVEFEKNKDKPKIDKLVGEYFEKHGSKFDEHLKKYYNKLNFIAGSGDTINYTKINEDIYEVESEIYSKLENEETICSRFILNVNIKANCVKLKNQMIIKNNLPVNNLRRIFNNYIFTKNR